MFNAKFALSFALLAAPLQVFATPQPGRQGRRQEIVTVYQNAEGEVYYPGPASSSSSTSSSSSVPVAGGENPQITDPPSAYMPGGDAAVCSSQRARQGTSGILTISVINSYGQDLMMSLGGDGGTIGPIGATVSTAVLPQATSAVYEFDSNWSGRIAIGKGVDSRGSKIEGSNTAEGPSINLSLVDGYTVPIVCSENTEDTIPFRGCSFDLFQQTGDKQCPEDSKQTSADGQGEICINKANTVGGYDQPASFFDACRATSYVFPKDDCGTAAWVANTIVCCVGTSCKAAQHQQASMKRSVASPKEENVMTMEKRTVGSPSLLARRHGHGGQKHGAMGFHEKA